MSLRSRAAAPLAAATLALGLATSSLTAPTPVLASNGYVETETTTYTVNPAARRLDVAIDVDFRNTQPSSATTVYYFSAVNVWVEHAATNLRATADSGSATPRHLRRSGGYDQYAVELGSAVYYGQTRTIHVTYQLPSGAPRSSSDIRIGKALASFCVVGQGDDGGTIRVVIPSGYDVSITASSSDELKPAAPSGGSGGTQTWSTGQIDQPYQYWACLSGTNSSGYTTSTTTSPGGRVIELQAWPEDPRWKSEVQGELRTILSKLETLVGQELPGHGPIVVQEVAGAELGAYAGFYNPETGVIVLGEDLGQGAVVAHELSHAWFNGQAFYSTWMSEGMAEWARISTIPDTCPQPTSYPGPGSPDLTDWRFAGPRATTTDVAVVDFQYAAACYLVSTLAAKAGPDRWRAVITALLDDQLAYQAPGLVLTRPRAPDTWQQWLDAVDEIGLAPGSATDLDFAQNLLSQYGIATDAAALGNRSRARTHYHAILATLGDWTMPEAVLRPMSAWSFTTAESAMAQVDAILASVAKADAALPGTDAANGPVRPLFERSKTVDDLKAAAALASDQAASADAVAVADSRVAAPREPLAQIGLLGADLTGPLADAAAAVKAGDVQAAQGAVAQVNGLLDDATGQGAVRLALAAGLLLGLLLLAFLLRRRRRRRRLAVAAALASVPAPDVPSVDLPPATGAPSFPEAPSPPEVPTGTDP